MSLRELPASPDLEHLKKQAKRLQREALEANATATDRFREAKILFDSKKYSDAVLEFSDFVKNEPGMPGCANDSSPPWVLDGICPP